MKLPLFMSGLSGALPVRTTFTKAGDKAVRMRTCLIES